MTKDEIVNLLLQKNLLLTANSNMLKKEVDFIGNYFSNLENHLLSKDDVIFFIIISKLDISFRELKLHCNELKIENYMLIDILMFIFESKPLPVKSKGLYEILNSYLNRTEIINFIGFISDKTMSNNDFTQVQVIMFINKWPHSEYDLAAIISRTNELKKDISRKQITYNNRKIALESFICSIKSFDDRHVYTIPKDIINILDQETVVKIYQFMLDKQVTTDEELTEQINSINFKNSEKKLEKMLNKFRLSLKLFSNPHLLINHSNLDNVENILNLFLASKIDISKFKENDLANILAFASLKEIDYILSLTSKSAINTNFIYLNPGLFLNESNPLCAEFTINSLYKKATENLKFLDALNIEYNENYDQNILLMDTKELAKNIKILKLYMKKLKNQNLWCKLITNPKLFKIIDFFAENDVDFNDINFNNLDENIDIDLLIKRMYIAINSKFPIFKNGMIDLNILSQIKDQNLDDFIASSIEISIPIEILDEFKKTKVTELDVELLNFIKLDEIINSRDGNIYFDDNIIISKNRFLRNFSILYNLHDKYKLDDLIFYALIYGSFLSDNEIERIKKITKKEK